MVRPVQLSNVYHPIDRRLSGKVTVSMPVQPARAVAVHATTWHAVWPLAVRDG